MSTDIWIVTGTDGDARALARQAAGRAGVETGDWIEKAILWGAGPGAHTVAAHGKNEPADAPPLSHAKPETLLIEREERLQPEHPPGATAAPVEENSGIDEAPAGSLLENDLYSGAAGTAGAGKSLFGKGVPLKESAWARLAQREWSGIAQRERAGTAWRKWSELARSILTALAPKGREKVAVRGAALAGAAILLALPFLWTPAGVKKPSNTGMTRAAAYTASGTSIAHEAAPSPPKPRHAALGKPTGAPEPEQMVSRLKESASAGDAKAQHDLGLLYAMGRYVKRDGRKAAIWLHRAAARGLVQAQFNLAVIYDVGQGVLRNPRKAFLLYLRAAQRNHVRAQHNLATAYARGAGIRKDYSKAARWFAAAAAAGAAASQFSLGLLYEYGVGVTRDRREATKWYGEAAKQGEARAAIRLGQLTTGTNEGAEFMSEEIQYLLSPLSFDTAKPEIATGGNR